MNTKTLEQLAADAQAATDALAAATLAAEQAKAAEKAAADRLKEVARREALRTAPEPASYTQQRKHLSAIAEALATLVKADASLAGLVELKVGEPFRRVTETDDGPEVHWRCPALEIFHRKQPVYTRIDFRAEESRGSSWRRGSYTGRLRCSVGAFGNSQSFPPRKDSTFNYTTIAEKLMGSIRDAERAAQDARKVHSNADALATLKVKFNLSKYSHVLEAQRSSGGVYAERKPFVQYAAPAGQLFLKIDVLATPEQAEALLKAALAVGVKLS